MDSRLTENDSKREIERALIEGDDLELWMS